MIDLPISNLKKSILILMLFYITLCKKCQIFLWWLNFHFVFYIGRKAIRRKHIIRLECRNFPWYFLHIKDDNAFHGFLNWNMTNFVAWFFALFLNDLGSLLKLISFVAEKFSKWKFSFLLIYSIFSYIIATQGQLYKWKMRNLTLRVAWTQYMINTFITSLKLTFYQSVTRLLPSF